MFRFSEYALTGVILYLTFKKQKYIRMWAWQQKRPRALIWRKTAILLSTDGPILTKLLKVDSLTLNRYITTLKINKISCKIKYLAQIVIFRPPQTPPCRI